MIGVLEEFSKFHSLVDEFKIMKLSRDKSGKHDGGTVHILQLDIHRTSDNNIKNIKGFLEANKYIIPKEMKEALLSIKRSYGNMKKQVDQSL